MSPAPLTAQGRTDVPTDLEDLEFELDFRVIEADYPIAKLACDTSDQCGSTCSGSACNTSANEPF